MPTVVVISDSGEVVGRFPLAGSIAAGDDATVTFAPFLRNDTGLSGIFFDVRNVGRALSIRTTSTSGPPFPASMSFISAGPMDFTTSDEFDLNGSSGTDFNLSMGNDVNIFPDNDANIQAGNNVNISGDGTTSVQGIAALNLQGGELQSTNSKVGFFGTTPVVQQATPVTLGDVIALLRAYGLAA